MDSRVQWTDMERKVVCVDGSLKSGKFKRVLKRMDVEGPLSLRFVLLDRK